MVIVDIVGLLMPHIPYHDAEWHGIKHLHQVFNTTVTKIKSWGNSVPHKEKSTGILI